MFTTDGMTFCTTGANVVGEGLTVSAGTVETSGAISLRLAANI
jgi:hypothetical protein